MPQGPAGPGFTPDQVAILNTMTLSSDPYLGGTNTLLTISGVNVAIVNGMGSTDTQNGLGNLTLGYNELRHDGTDNHLGSHNIITGIYNSYALSGGIIGGYENNMTGSEDFVVGALNTVRGNQSAVSGGYTNTASGDYSSVSGGFNNSATNTDSSVSGGQSNKASGPTSSISGGNGLTESHSLGWKGGSQGNTFNTLGNFVSD